MSIEAAIHDYMQRRISRDELMRRLEDQGVTPATAATMAGVLDHAVANPGAPADLTTASRALTAAEYKTIEAMAGRIVPATDTPGAIEAGAADYIDLALAGAYRDQLDKYRSGIAALDRYCLATHAKPFVALSPEHKDAALERMESGAVDDFPAASSLFELVRTHVLEGLLCEPYYGGNRNLVGWKLVGFPGMRYGYDESYVNKPIDLAPVATGNHPPREDA